MIRSLRNAPIRKKLVAVILLTSGLVLAGSMIAFVVDGALSFRRDSLKALESTATVIGSNSVASILFMDPKVADESLSGLKKNESILAAYLLTDNDFWQSTSPRRRPRRNFLSVACLPPAAARWPPGSGNRSARRPVSGISAP
jgi:hypothetical protein